MIIIYDFDGTLTPFGIPKYKILEENGYNEITLMSEAKSLVHNKGISLYEAFYDIYFNLFKKNEIALNAENILYGSDSIIFNSGVIDFFDKFANKENGIHNYIVTAGIKEYVDNNIISGYVEEIFGVELEKIDDLYTGIKYLLDDKQKPVVIKKILDSEDYKSVVYIGDGLTDLEAFSYVKSIGGTTIFVGETDKDYSAFNQLKEKELVDYYFIKDYSENSDLRKFLQKIHAECQAKKKVRDTYGKMG